MKNNFIQPGNGHCLICHESMMPGETHYKTCMGKNASSCTEDCGKWYKKPNTNACGCSNNELECYKKWKHNIGMLRQWLNEERITDKKQITNEEIEYWLNL